MAELKEARVPDIGDFDGVPVIELLVAVGDTVTVDQGLVTLESDKATMEVPAPFAGVVREIKVKIGDKVAEGALVAMIEASDAPAAAPSSTSAQPAEAAQVPAPNAQPRPAETPERVEPVATSGTPDTLTQRDIAMHAQVPAPNAQPRPAESPERAEPVATSDAPDTLTQRDIAVHASAPASKAAEPRTPPVTFDASELMPDAVPYASPAVRLFARELGVDLSRVKGSAKGGRITRDDVQGHVRQAMQGAATAASPAGGGVMAGGGLNLLPWPNVDFTKFGAIEVRELSRIRKLSGANLARNWAMIPHVTQHDHADITELEDLRVALNRENEKSGTKVTMLAFLMKAVVAGLKKFPDFNASLDASGETLVLKKYFHVGFAADTPNGLVVPVIRDVDRKGVTELATETAELAKKARDGKLSPAEMSGGCFTISSLGGIGGTAFTPIINAPEVAILGVSKSAITPVWDGTAFQPRLLLPLSLSYDHRVIDGAAAARFTAYVAQLMADLRRVLL